MTRFEKIQAWDSTQLANFIVTIIKNTVEDFTKDANELNFDDVRWEVIAQNYEDFLNGEDEEE